MVTAGAKKLVALPHFNCLAVRKWLNFTKNLELCVKLSRRFNLPSTDLDQAMIMGVIRSDGDH